MRVCQATSFGGNFFLFSLLTGVYADMHVQGSGRQGQGGGGRDPLQLSSVSLGSHALGALPCLNKGLAWTLHTAT